MNDYEKGQEIGEIRADIKNLALLLQAHNQKQDLMNEAMDRRVKLLEIWVSSTTGKVVVLTALFGIVGSTFYLVINWFLNHRLK